MENKVAEQDLNFLFKLTKFFFKLDQYKENYLILQKLWILSFLRL